MTPGGPWSTKPTTSGNLLHLQDAQEIHRARGLVAGANRHFDSPLELRALLGGRIAHDPIRTERARRALGPRHSCQTLHGTAGIYAISFAIANAAAAASPPTTAVCQALRKGLLPVKVPFT